ncbi:MAG TPA: hypothetical protein VM263_10260 [Acidimicrobiales bacterium]|nr:hypothetical protein [Acidimicrobiales bacterium]HVM03040.1 hypothetical protein [Acidimicrobiales bacterium]
MPPNRLDATARRYAAVERRLFEVVGAWVPDTPEPEVKLALRLASFRHAWHAELWEGLAGAAPLHPEEADVGPLLAAVTTAERLTAFYGVVLPGLVGGYERLLGEAADDVAAGGPLRRLLTLALADDRAELAEGRRLLAEHGHGEPPAPSEGHQSH